ncbi:MAG: GNAT family N-acetyltransferase [Bryobacterales bacterium]|nr:GNAT family N-acetyltransferase [Bryobacterales bacterium]
MTPVSKIRIREDVQLAPLTPAHAGRMFTWMKDPWVSDNLGLRSTPSLEATEAWIARALADESTCPFAILLAGEHVGNVILDRIDRYLSTARLSVYVGENQARAKGVASTGIWLAVRHGFCELGLHKIWLTVHALHPAAIRAYVNLGFQVEGVLRGEFLLRGERVPALYMGILAEEFGKQQTVKT